jgi:hypothetical protein
VAIGSLAATNQGTGSVVIGFRASTRSGDYSIGIGYQAALGSVGATRNIFLGSNTINQQTFQDSNAISIGCDAFDNIQGANSILINASGIPLLPDPSPSSLYITPIRNSTGPYLMYYNDTTKEITYSITGGTGVFSSGIQTSGIQLGTGTILTRYIEGTETNVQATYNTSASTGLNIGYRIIGNICTIIIPTFSFVGDNSSGITLSITGKNINPSISSTVSAITLQGGVLDSSSATISPFSGTILFRANSDFNYNGVNSGFPSNGCSITYPL